MNIEAGKMKQLQPGEKRVSRSEVIVSLTLEKTVFFVHKLIIIVVRRRILN